MYNIMNGRRADVGVRVETRGRPDGLTIVRRGVWDGEVSRR